MLRSVAQMDAVPSAPAVVAVVVACDPGGWFEDVLRSLAAQDYRNLSVLVVDVGEGAGTRDAGATTAEAGGAPGEDGTTTAEGGKITAEGGVETAEGGVDTAEGGARSAETKATNAKACVSTAERVAALLPDAHLATLPAGTSFTQATNAALGMVEGASHVLICHDDMALDPDAVRLLLEEAYRSNAGLTCPKFVSWDAPDHLLSVGMGADRLGVVHPLVQRGELDQGQHDGAREVFVAPSGATLVRTDLWRALGGFGHGPGAPGEDLDICWRAQLAGARVVVAPQARARHLEASTKKLRTSSAVPVPALEERQADVPSGRGPGADADGRLQRGANGSPRRDLDERVRQDEHRLRTLWTCYSGWGLPMVVPVVLAFCLGESAWALLRRRGGAAVVVPLLALAGSVRRPRELWASRRRTQALRRASDLSLWRSQSRGSARLRAVVRLRLEKGHELAWAASRATVRGRRGLTGPAGEPTSQAGAGSNRADIGWPEAHAPSIAFGPGVNQTGDNGAHPTAAGTTEGVDVTGGLRGAGGLPGPALPGAKQPG